MTRWHPSDVDDFNPNMGEPPQQWYSCDTCGSDGYIEVPRFQPDDSYFAIAVKCDQCWGAGGWLDDAQATSEG